MDKNSQISEMELRKEIYSLIFNKVLKDLDFRQSLAGMINDITKRENYDGYEYLDLDYMCKKVLISTKKHNSASRTIGNWADGISNPNSISIINSIIILVIEKGNYEVLKEGIKKIIFLKNDNKVSLHIYNEEIENQLGTEEKEDIYIILKRYLYSLKRFAVLEKPYDKKTIVTKQKVEPEFASESSSDIEMSEEKKVKQKIMPANRMIKLIASVVLLNLPLIVVISHENFGYKKDISGLIVSDSNVIPGSSSIKVETTRFPDTFKDLVAIRPASLKILKPEHKSGLPEGTINMSWDHNIPLGSLSNAGSTCLQLFDRSKNPEMIRNLFWDGIVTSYSTQLPAGRYGILVSVFDKESNILSTGQSMFYVDALPTDKDRITIFQPEWGEHLTGGTIIIKWNHNMSPVHISTADRTCLQIFDHNNNCEIVRQQEWEGINSAYTTSLPPGKYGVLVSIYDRKDVISTGETLFYVGIP